MLLFRGREDQVEGAPGGKLSCPNGLRLLSLSRTSPVVCRRDRGHRTGPKADRLLVVIAIMITRSLP